MRAILLLLPLAACAAPDPAPTRDLPAAIQPPSAWAAGAPAGPMEESWWTKLGSAALGPLVEEALAHNLDLGAAAARLEAALVQSRLAGAERLPTLEAGLDAARRKQNFIGLPIPGSTGVLSRTFTTFGADLTASWEVDLWGRVRAGERAALADLQAADADLRAAQLSLAAQTARAFFAAVEARLQEDLARGAVATFRATLADVRERFARGTRPSVDVHFAEANLAAGEAALALRREQLQRATRQLELLLGRYPSGAVQLETRLPTVTGPVPAGLPAELLRRRPDLVAAERRAAGQDQRVAAAVASLYPRIAITGSAGTSTQEFRDLIDPDFFVWSLLGNITQPLFQGGRLRGQVELAQARLREAAANYASAAQRAFTDVETALAVEQSLAEREQFLRRATVESALARTLAEERYRTGIDTIVSVLEAQRRAIDSESQALSARRLRLDARIGLYAALGGGFAPPQTPPTEIQRSEPQR